MFYDIGNKIKRLVSTITGISIFLEVLGGLIFVFIGLAPIGVIVMLVGSFLTWISSFALYGYGEIITQLDDLNCNIQRQTDMLYRVVQEEKEIKRNESKSEVLEDGRWICKNINCRNVNRETATFCTKCGTSK